LPSLGVAASMHNFVKDELSGPTRLMSPFQDISHLQHISAETRFLTHMAPPRASPRLEPFALWQSLKLFSLSSEGRLVLRLSPDVSLVHRGVAFLYMPNFNIDVAAITQRDVLPQPTASCWSNIRRVSLLS